ncbi:MAG: DUF2279 domain-containing protein [Flavobacteriia bacterium]|nr:DUF2279 domain-containing protein [Flavobacteriia bacterium]
MFIFYIFYSVFSLCQNRFAPTDTINRSRVFWVSSSISSLSIGSLFALQKVWYSDYPSSALHSFDDSKNWMAMDKMGHAYTCYSLSKLNYSLYRWSGLNQKKSLLIGGGIAWSYQFIIELMDGKSSNWGFSWTDLSFNTLGTLWFTSQELIFHKQIFQLKFSYYPSTYAQYRPNVLGKTWNESLLKDYNGQMYCLSFSPFELIKSSKLKFLQLSLGYSVDAKLVGDQNVFIHESGKTFYAKKEFLLGLDIQLSKLPIKKKWLKTLLSPFDLIKIPLPGLLWRNNVCYLGVY